jgi:hypothetical protein
MFSKIILKYLNFTTLTGVNKSAGSVFNISMGLNQFPVSHFKNLKICKLSTQLE